MAYSSHKREIFLTEYLPSLIMAVIGLGSYFAMLPFPSVFPHSIQCLSFVALSCLPLIIYWIFRFRLAPLIKIIYFAFVFFAMLLANAYNLYSYIPEYDKFLHLFSGPFTALLAMYVLVFTGTYEKISQGMAALFMFLADMAIGSLWEITEYAVDLWLNNNSQHNLETGVVDTMTDILANAIGGVVFVLIFFIDILWNKAKVTDWTARHLSVYTRHPIMPGKERKDR